MKPLKILLVDDQPDFIETLTFWLKSKGHAVSSALDGEGGIQLIQTERFDLVFLDVHMPKMDGLEALAKIRTLNKNLHVILLTAYPEEGITDKAKELGISGFFPKEGNFEKLTNAIEVALRIYKS